MMMRRKVRWTAPAVAIAAMVFACSAPADAPAKVPLGGTPGAGAAAAAGPAPEPVLSPDAKKALDSGNALFRAGSAAKKKNDAALAGRRYAEALLQYRRSAQASPDHAAPWFGIQMVAKERDNKALADSAVAAIRARSAAPSGSGTPHDMSDSTLNRLRAKMKSAAPIG